MTTLPPAWDVPAGEERIGAVRAKTKNPRWVRYCYTASDNTPFTTMARTPEIARTKRDLWLESRGMTVPKPEPPPKPSCTCEHCCAQEASDRWVRDTVRGKPKGAASEVTG